MTLTAGTRLGPYEVLTPLGAGGMGEVYRARDTRLGRSVAIKVLPEAISAEAERLRRFEKESRAASSLNHPNIVTIYDVGTTDSRAYIAMELVEGKTLRELLNTGPVPLRRLLALAAQMADGLAMAHEAGIVHRDLKPENVMVTKDGLAKILDFGLAKLTHAGEDPGAESRLPTLTRGTEPGVVMGTVGYMSPEQASGRALDFRSDQFSFGSILYEMVTGSTAFARSTAAETLTAIIREEPEHLAAAAPAAPVPLRWIVERCLAKEPQERYGSTRDLARDLASLRDHLSEMSLSAGAAAAVAPRRRPWLRAGLLALAVLATIAGALLLGKSLGQTPVPSFQRLTFRRGAVTGARFAPDGRTVIYGAAWEGAPIQLYSTRLERPESSRLDLPNADVAAISSTGEMAILLDRPFHYGNVPSTLARVGLAGGAPRPSLQDVRGADWSRDGTTLALVRDLSGKTRLEYPPGKVLYESSPGGLGPPRISPKGDRVAFVDEDGAVAVVDLEGKKKKLSAAWSRLPGGLAWSPSGDEVWFTANQGGYFTPLYAVTLSGRLRVVMRFPAWVTLFDILPDGRALLMLGTPHRYMFARPFGEPAERELSWHDGSDIRGLSADGKTLLFVEQGEKSVGSFGVGATYLRRTDGSPAVRLGDGWPIGLSADARWAVVLDLENGSQFTLLPTGAGEPRVLKGEGVEYDEGSYVGWFPDGKRLLVTGHESDRPLRSYVQRLEGGRPVPFGPVGSVCHDFSPDGRQIVCDDEKGAFLWVVEGGERRPIPGLLAGEFVWAWSADGKSLFVQEARGPGKEPRRSYKVVELELATGRRRPWMEIGPSDRTGIKGGIIGAMVNGGSYAYSYGRLQSDLYVVDGLK